jgi:endogenous inhibitor of DNA gyrase (YacG/DUF329 family)
MKYFTALFELLPKIKTKEKSRCRKCGKSSEYSYVLCNDCMKKVYRKSPKNRLKLLKKYRKKAKSGKFDTIGRCIRCGQKVLRQNNNTNREFICIPCWEKELEKESNKI